MIDHSYKVLALSRQQSHHFKHLAQQPGFNVVETADWVLGLLREHTPDILLTPSTDWYESVACIQEARRLGIPSLLVMDGILEWRHEWENPRFGAGDGAPYDQPALTDKIACLGWQSARTLEGWGNVGKCEIVGATRFDDYLERRRLPRETRAPGTPRRLLIMTANTPGFTAEQVRLVEQSLLDVRDYLQSTPDWEPIWRVRRGLDQKLGLNDHFSTLRGQPLIAVLAEADAVLTTPSTTLLESMLAGLPTAMLDYTNSPPYVPAAWMITAQAHIQPVLTDLSDPPTPRLVFQDEVLHNTLECRSPALPRLVQLVETMIRIGREARAAGTPPVFPARIIPLESGGQVVPSELFDLSALYPHHPIFANRDLNDLQLELTHTRKELAALRREVSRRGPGHWLAAARSLARKALAKP